jgi:hypothetical protein
MNRFKSLVLVSLLASVSVGFCSQNANAFEIRFGNNHVDRDSLALNREQRELRERRERELRERRERERNHDRSRERRDSEQRHY